MMSSPSLMWSLPLTSTFIWTQVRAKKWQWFVETALPGFQPQRSAEITPLSTKMSASSHVFIPSEGITEMKTVVNKFLFSYFLHHKFIQADVTDRKKQKHIHVPM